MKKSVGSFVGLNRKAFLLLGFMLSVGVFGIMAWRSSAQEQSGATSSSRSGTKR